MYAVIYIIWPLFSCVLEFISKRKKLIRKFIYWIIVICLILIAGTRFETGFDYYNYLEWYARSQAWQNVVIEAKRGLLLWLGFYIFNVISVPFYFVLFCITALSIYLKAHVIYKFSNYPLFSIALYIGIFF
jgi:hypothetical protein